MSSPAYNIFGPLDSVLGGQQTMAYILLALVLLNVITRMLAHRRNVKEADDGGASTMSRHPLHTFSNVALLLSTFYYTTLDQHTGIVASMLIVGMFITDFFEYESRKVDARREIKIEPPKGAIVASMFVLLYVGYLSLFQFVEPFWSAVV